MLFWLASIARRSLRGATIIPDGARGADLEGRARQRPHWPAHNYQHLMEQPTIFYAIVFALVLMGFDRPSMSILPGVMWASDRPQHLPGDGQRGAGPLLVVPRATLCLIGLTTHAAIFLIHHG